MQRLFYQELVDWYENNIKSVPLYAVFCIKSDV